MGEPDASDGGGADGSLLDAQRVPALSSATSAMGGSEATGASTKKHCTATRKDCRMTTLYWGATLILIIGIFPVCYIEVSNTSTTVRAVRC